MSCQKKLHVNNESLIRPPLITGYVSIVTTASYSRQHYICFVITVVMFKIRPHYWCFVNKLRLRGFAGLCGGATILVDEFSITLLYVSSSDLDYVLKWGFFREMKILLYNSKIFKRVSYHPNVEKNFSKPHSSLISLLLTSQRCSNGKKIEILWPRKKKIRSTLPFKASQHMLMCP